MSTSPVAHWDDIEAEEADVGPIGGRWRDLGAAAGSRRLGANRIEVSPGRAATPLHAEDEEIFYVLGGSGFSYQEDGCFAIGAGDVVYYKAWSPAHTAIAADDGLDVIALGTHGPFGGTRFPRLSAVKILDMLVDGDRTHQFRREAKLGPIELPAEPDPRPETIVNVGDVDWFEFRRAPTAARARFLGRRLGARELALNLAEIEPGSEAARPHCHSAVEELFVVLDGDGALLLGDDEHPVRAGSVVARPAGTGVAHAFRAGEQGMTVLMFSDVDPGDMCFYPRSGKVLLVGLGVVFKPEQVPYLDD